VALTLAVKAGIRVPVWRFETVANQAVLLLRRFDREQVTRLPFLSAMRMLDAKDNRGPQLPGIRRYPPSARRGSE
jgi:serine/threonine-protein kinase HipA